jgi:hypothetical protein
MRQRLLGLVEQPRVIDGDQRLVAEGFGERNVGLREMILALADDSQHADAFFIAQQRQQQRRVNAVSSLYLPLEGRQLDERPVRQMQGLPVNDDARWEVRGRVDPRRHPSGARLEKTRRSGDGDGHEALIVTAQKVRRIAAEQTHGSQHDGFEHGLHVAFRLADDAQDFRCRGLTCLRLAKLRGEAHCFGFRARALRASTARGLDGALARGAAPGGRFLPFLFRRAVFCRTSPHGRLPTALGNSIGFGRYPVGAAEQNRDSAGRSLRASASAFCRPQNADSSTLFCPIQRNRGFERV